MSAEHLTFAQAREVLAARHRAALDRIHALVSQVTPQSDQHEQLKKARKEEEAAACDLAALNSWINLECLTATTPPVGFTNGRHGPMPV